MENLESVLDRGMIGITVYSPDVFYSGLSVDIDMHIIQRTGLKPIFRYQFCHTAQTIEKFYETGVYKNVPNWHYVVDFFKSGPSLLTFWYGDEAIDRLNTVKGKSHPARAEKNTVRGRFLCDNAICNLIHTSDDVPEMIRELTAIGRYGLLKVPFCDREINSSFFNGGRDRLSHNGAYTFLKVISRINNIKFDIETFQYSDSASLYNSLIKEIHKVEQISEPAVKKIIKAFLRGDEEVGCELEKYVVSAEEIFIIRCSAATRSGWEEQKSLDDTICALLEILKGQSGFFIGGSSATKLYGYQCLSDDIDVICTDEAIEEIAKNLSLEIYEVKKEFGTYRCCKYELCGYEVEFSTMADYVKKYNICIDEEMLNRTTGRIPLMPPEDIIIELYSLNRTDYHNDIVRAKKFYAFLGNTIDHNYLKKRFAESGLGTERYDELTYIVSK